MPEEIKTLESLLDKVIDYAKISVELFKMKILAKFTDIISSLIPSTFIALIFASFFFFLNFGIAFLLGEFLGKIYLGFFILSGFYFVIAIAIRLLFYKQIKRYIGNYFVKLITK